MKDVKIKRIKKDQLLFKNNTNRLVTINFINRYNQQGRFDISPKGTYLLHFTKSVKLSIPNKGTFIIKKFTNNEKSSREIADNIASGALEIACDIGEEVVGGLIDNISDIGDIADGASGILEGVFEFIGDIIEGIFD